MSAYFSNKSNRDKSAGMVTVSGKSLFDTLTFVCWNLQFFSISYNQLAQWSFDFECLVMFAGKREENCCLSVFSLFWSTSCSFPLGSVFCLTTCGFLVWVVFHHSICFYKIFCFAYFCKFLPVSAFAAVVQICFFRFVFYLNFIIMPYIIQNFLFLLVSLFSRPVLFGLFFRCIGSTPFFMSSAKFCKVLIFPRFSPYFFVRLKQFVFYS